MRVVQSQNYFARSISDNTPRVSFIASHRNGKEMFGKIRISRLNAIEFRPEFVLSSGRNVFLSNKRMVTARRRTLSSFSSFISLSLSLFMSHFPIEGRAPDRSRNGDSNSTDPLVQIGLDRAIKLSRGFQSSLDRSYGYNRDIPL